MRSHGREKGFIITLELIVLMTIFGVVFLFAFQMIEKWLINEVGNYFGTKILVFDSTGPAGSAKFVGKAVGFDEFGAPLVIIRDTTLSPPPAAVLGIRSWQNYPNPAPASPGGFASRMRVYYRAANCAGSPVMLNPYARDWGSQNLNNGTTITGRSDEPVQDVYALQGIAYAIGYDPATGSSQTLFRLAGVNANTFSYAIRSYWDSEIYPSGACVDLSTAAPLPVLNRVQDATAVAILADPTAGAGAFQTPFWIPAATNNIITAISGGSMTFAPATNGEASAPPPTPVKPGYQAPCAEGTPGCPQLP